MDELAVPTFALFAAYFIDTYATTNNRPSTVREKRRALRRGLLDELGHLSLDEIGAHEIGSLGHASLTMTMRYAHLSPSARRAAAELLDAAPPRHHSGTAEPLNV